MPLILQGLVGEWKIIQGGFLIQGMNWYGNEIYDEIVLTGGVGGGAVWESRGLGVQGSEG